MAFVLRVTQGAGEGESQSFESEARLGRTADNDLVIKDPSSSRSHARVFEKGSRFYVEDLKSQNGTLLNGAELKAPRPLSDGDRIAIGDVELEFSIVTEDPETAGEVASETMAPGQLEPVADDPPELPEDADPNETARQPPRPSRNRPVTRPPPRRLPRRVEPEPEPEPEEPPPEEDEAGAEDPPPSRELAQTRHTEVPPPRAVQRRPAGAPVRARPVYDEEVSELTAADKARRRRQLQKSGSGRIQLLWESMSKPVQIVVGTLLILMGTGGLSSLAWWLWPKQVVRKVEPLELVPNTDPIRESFGSGPDVDFRRPDMKSFSFTYNSPTRVVGVLHYQASGITKGEVNIELNGTDLGSIPPDVIDTNGRELDAVLPAASVKVGQANELVFDNVNNPPNDDAWRIWNVWVEVIPTPEMNAEEASRRAKDAIDRAGKYYDLRDVGAENLFRAWKTYRDAWLLLEATPDRPESLHQISRTRMREIRPELDRKCSGMLVEYKKVMNQSVPDVMQARKVLEDIPTHFPTREHPCNSLSRSLLSALEDLQEAPEP